METTPNPSHKPPRSSPTADTQPIRAQANHPPSQEKKPRKQKGIPKGFVRGIWIFATVLFLIGASASGGLAGYTIGQSQKQSIGANQVSQSIQEQYQLGLTDFQEGRLEIALQRLEWVIKQDPNYPGAPEKLAQVMSILYATATPTQIPPTFTPTPTPDLRPIQERFAQAQDYFTAQDWANTIATLVSLRKSDPLYQVVEVDRMLFISIRMQGIEKIFRQGDLEGGIYDLALAERFSPLDIEAQSAREWARIYLLGSSFWEVYPEKAVYFFSQVASALPSLRDASGWTAIERLRASLIQWGDQLMEQEEWCVAQNKYEQASQIRYDAQLQTQLEVAFQKCTPPTATLTATSTLTSTLTLTPTYAYETPVLSPTTTSTPTPTPSLEPTEPQPATETPTPPIFTDTPEPPSPTPEPPTQTPSEPTPTPGGTGSLLVNSILRFGSMAVFLGIVHPVIKPIDPIKKRNVKKRGLNLKKKWFLPLILMAIILLLGLGAGFTSFIIGRELALFGTGLSFINGPNITNNSQVSNTEDQTTVATTTEPGFENDNLINISTLAPWDGAGRVTVLLLGLDYRDWEAGEKYSRSDTMILLTLDPLTKTAGILSVPRDMWVAIPGFKHGKINTAYYLGEAYKLPGGGPALAVKTVESFLGIPINYYAQVDFDSFVRFVDEIGGVKITIPKKITVDLLGAGPKTKKTLKPGEQVLPGQYALAYARNRYTEGGDFDRAGRQQQVIMGIRNRILEFDLLPNLIAKAPSLYQELSSGIRTNLTLDELIRLALLAKSIPDEKIQQGVLGKEYVLFAESPDKLSILIPLPDKIHLLRDQIFAATGGLGPGTPGQSVDQMKAENPRLAVFNGSTDDSLLNKSSNWLSTQGASVTQAENAEQVYLYTTVIDYTGNPFTIKYLVETLGINQNRIIRKFDPNYPIDVEIILGNDLANNNPFN